MKYFRLLLIVTLAVNVFQSCKDDDETSYVLQDISAPTNLSAVFDIADDDSGEVSVTPTGVGAASFEVYFGDVENETPVDVNPGETVNHVYGEGEYTLRIVAIGTTGLTSELSRIVTISFTPPSNLNVEVTISSTNPFEITVDPSAENATVFDVYFGDAENETPTTIMSGETINHTYAEVGSYEVRVVARGAGAATIESTQTVEISGAMESITLPITFDLATVNYAFSTFNGASFEVVDNPDNTGAHTIATKVGAITNSGAAYEGGAFNLGTPVDFSGSNKTITMKLWSSTAVPVLLKFEGGVNGDERQCEVTANHSGSGWEILSFDFATDAVKSYIDGSQGVGESFVPTGQYATMVIFIDGPGTTAGTFYIDDIAQEGGVALQAPNLPLDFESGDIYDYTWNGFGASDFGPIPAAVIANPDASGINTSGNVVEIKKTAGAQVWAGASLNLDGAIDWTNGTTIGVKVWSPRVGTPILLKIEDSTSPADGNGNPTIFAEVSATSTVASAWEELTFDMTTFGAFSTSESYDRVILFPDFGNAGSDELFYFDDITLGDGSAGGSEPTAAAPTPSEGAANVISMFSDTYTDVPVDTWRTDWSSATLEDITVASNAVKKYSALNFVGIETVANQIDATSMTHFRTDIWTADATEFRIKLVDFGADGAFGGGDDVEHEIAISNPAQGEWVSLDIPLSDFIGLTTKANIAQLIYSADPSGATTVYVDNVYFYAELPTAPTSAAPTPTLNAANVISMFSDAYTDVPVDTWRTDWSNATLEDITVASDAVKKYSALSFVGVETVANQIDATSMTHFHTDIWTADATTFRIKLVDFGADGAFGGGDDVEHEISITSPAQGEWVSLDIPLTDFTGLTTRANIAQLIYSGDPSGAITVYVDNVYFHN